MCICTLTAPGVPITSFDAALVMADVWNFKASAYLDSVLSSTGLSEQQVVLDSVNFRVAVPYALLWASVQIGDAEMAAAVAAATMLDPSQVSIRSGRRLSEDEASEQQGSRRLQNLFQVYALTDNAADLASMQAKLGDPNTLEASLAASQIEARLSVTVSRAAVGQICVVVPDAFSVPQARMQLSGSAQQEVLVSTRLFAADPLFPPVDPPDPAVLSTDLSQRLGIVIDAQIENEARSPPAACKVSKAFLRWLHLLRPSSYRQPPQQSHSRPQQLCPRRQRPARVHALAQQLSPRPLSH